MYELQLNRELSTEDRPICTGFGWARRASTRPDLADRCEMHRIGLRTTTLPTIRLMPFSLSSGPGALGFGLKLWPMLRSGLFFMHDGHRPASPLHQSSVFMKATSYDYNVAKPLGVRRNNGGKITTPVCCVRGHPVQ